MTASVSTIHGTLIWVHGTGVRQKAFDRTWANFKRHALDRKFNPSQLRACNWGPSQREGVPDKRLIDAALPRYRLFGVLEDDEEGKLDAARTLLAIDPLFELRLHGIGTAEGISLAGDIPTRLMTVGKADIRGSGISARELSAAGNYVRNSQEFAAAAQSGLFANEAGFDAAVARAVIARLEQRHMSDPPGSQPVAFRVAAIRANLLSGISGHLGVDASLADVASDPLMEFAGFLGNWLRGWATGLGVNFFADVFWHVRACAIQDAIANEIHQAHKDGCERPFVVVGHSLGGIAALDLLTDPDRSHGLDVELLVTYGSQSSILYAMDAMRYLRLRAVRATKPIPVWLNLYDRNDLIAFAMGPLGALATKQVEKEIRSRLLFPFSHSAYVDQDDFWDLLLANWPHTPSLRLADSTQ